MNTISQKFLRTAGLVSATSIAIGATQLIAADKTDALPVFDSYIKVSGQAASIKGDGAAYEARNRTGDQLGAGIEEAHYSKDLSKDTSLTLDGRALSGSDDYLINLKLVKTEVGSVDVGYKQFRTFYDGVGGFFPGNRQFAALGQTNPSLPQELFVDRGEFWAEAKFGRPDTPEFKIRYTNGTRNGQKDSTSWGATDNTGQAYGAALPGVTGNSTNAQVRRDIPSYLDINERHQALDGSVKQTVGNTTAEVGLLGDWSSKNNTRVETAFPGEALTLANAYAAPTVGTGAANWQTFANEIDYNTVDRQDTFTKGVNGTTVTELGPKLTMRLGASYQDVASDFGGDRVLMTAQNISGGPVTTYNVQNLAGRSGVDLGTAKIAFDYKPFSDFTVSLGVRGENKNSGSYGSYDVVSASKQVTPKYLDVHMVEAGTLNEQSLTPVLDLRYSGFKNLALYSTVTHKTGDGTQDITPAYGTYYTVNNGAPSVGTATMNSTSGAITATAGSPLQKIYHSNISENNTDYVVGANWRACSGVTLRAEPFYKNHDYLTTGYNTVNGGTYTADNYNLTSQFWGVKLTGIVSPLSTLTFTNRYIYQIGKMQVAAGNFTANDSMESTSNTFGETIDWTPIQQFYMQASADVVFNVISTVGANQTPYSTAAPGSIPVDFVIQNSNNNYVTYSLLAGAVITKTDDLQLKWSAYKSTNNDASISTYGTNYGASMSEYTITLGLKHKLSDRCIATGKVGYFESHNDLTGGNTDFHGPLAYVSLEYGL